MIFQFVIEYIFNYLPLIKQFYNVKSKFNINHSQYSVLSPDKSRLLSTWEYRHRRNIFAFILQVVRSLHFRARNKGKNI